MNESASKKKYQVNGTEVENNGKNATKILLVSIIVTCILAIFGFLTIPLGTRLEGAGRHGNGLGIYALLAMPIASLVLLRQLRKGIAENKRKPDEVKESKVSMRIFILVNFLLGVGFVFGELKFLEIFAEAAGMR